MKSEKMNILELTISESLALDRLLEDILRAIHLDKKSVSIPLTNKYFIGEIVKIQSKRYSDHVQLIKKLTEELLEGEEK